MNLLRWCFSFLTLVSLSCGSDGSDCKLHHEAYHGIGTILYKDIRIHCKPRNNSPVISIELDYDRSLEIKCNRALKWSDFDYERTPEPQTLRYFDFDSCQLLESRQIDFIKQNLPLGKIDSLRLISLNFDVALNLSQSILEDLKENIFYLHLESNHLTDSSSDFLREFPYLFYLNLTSNVFGKLPNDFLTSPSLRRLDLKANGLEEINSKTFSGIKANLSILILEEENLHRIESDSFNDLVSLVFIEINCKRLQILPANIFTGLRGLEKLIFSNNSQSLKTLPNKFLANMKSLHTITLSGNGLVTLPEDLFFGSIKLRVLSMEDNDIESLPPQLFKDCKQLFKINLSNNKINSLPEGFFSNQENLGFLTLSNNQIDVLQNGIFLTQTKLKSLDLSNNQIKILPNGIFSNQMNLYSLDLSNNHITTISRSVFEGFIRLTLLNMTANNLQIIEDSSWELWAHTIILSHNHLRLENLTQFRFSCENLDLSYNHISHLSNYWFRNPRLRNLNLQHNNLENITIEDLHSISVNLTIDFRYNRIKEIVKKLEPSDRESPVYPPAERFMDYIIKIGNNPMDCDCKVYDFLVYLEKKVNNSVQFNVSSLECQEPSRLNNTPLISLKSETLTCLIDEPQKINATCPEKCECWRRPSNLTYIIDCSNRGLGRAPEKIKGPAKHQIELNLTNNSLTNMPSLSRPGYNKVTVLLLSHNKIDNVPFQSLFENLRILELHNNKLSKIDTSIFDHFERSPNLKKLTLHNNLWECNCEQKGFLKFIQATRSRLDALNNVACGEMKQKLYLISSEDFCSYHLLIVSCIGIALFGIIVAMYYRFQQEIKVWLYAKQWCLWLVSEDELDKDKIYDAFISYAHQDDDFVVNELVAKLEEGPKPFKLCVHFRDWLPGEYIADQVARSVEYSKRTVIVLSANFIQSDWGRMEFHAAHSQALNDGRTRVIVIIYGEIPPLDELDSELRAYLTMNTYVKWGDPWFWKKLQFALPHRI